MPGYRVAINRMRSCIPWKCCWFWATQTDVFADTRWLGPCLADIRTCRQNTTVSEIIL